MFCSKCGTQVQQNAQFCQGCGAPQQAQAAPQVYQQPQPAQQPHSYQQAPQGQYAPTGPQYGGFWIRLVAALIDGLIISIIGYLGSLIVGFVVGGFVGMVGNADAGIGMGMLAGGLFSFVINWYYFTYMESSKKQATFGKAAVGLIVTDLNGNRISFGKANVRFFSKILSCLILYIGFLMVAFTKKKQGLHDMIAETLVIKK